MRNSAGLTLVELLTALGVAAVLATVAAPAFGTLALDARRTAAVNEFFHALFLTRAEAIKRAEVVSLCKSSDRRQCDPRAPLWSTGWIVFVNRNRDEPPQRSPDEPLLFVSAGWPAGRITSNRVAYSFRPATQSVVNGTVVFCDVRGSAHARAIIISHTGRPRVADRDANHKALRCPPG
jgi:type IV fimbrial biogenesis protein FimT